MIAAPFGTHFSEGGEMRTVHVGRIPKLLSARGGSGVVSAVALVAALVLGGCGGKEPPKLPPPEVLVAPVVQRDVPLYQDWVGTIEGYVNAQIRPKVQGYLLEQTYQNGHVVKAGQLLFQIDPRQFEA